MRPPLVAWVIGSLMVIQASALLPYSLPYFTPGKEARTAEPPTGHPVRFVKPGSNFQSGSGSTTPHTSSLVSVNTTSYTFPVFVTSTSPASTGTSLPADTTSGSSTEKTIPRYTNSSVLVTAPTSLPAAPTTESVFTTLTSTITVVNLDGSAVPLDQPAVTYALRGGPPIIISGGSVVLASSTFLIPSVATTVTADGVPVTFGGLSITERILITMTTPDKTNSQGTDGGPDTTLEATKTTDSPPSETPKTDDPDTPFDHTWLPLPVVVKINGAEYYPPTEHEEPIDIFLNDGSTAVLAYKSLKIGDRTINIPDKAPPEPQTIDGVQIAQRSFDSSGGGGSAPGSPAANPFDAMKRIFSGLSASAGPLALAVSGFSAKAVRVALNAPGGPLSETGFSEAIELQDLAQDAMNLAERATQFQNQLEAARMSQAGQADLFKPINSVVFSAYPKVRASTNLLRSVAQMLQNLPNIPMDIQGAITQRLGDVFVKGVASVGFIVEAYNIYAILHNIDWDNIAVPGAGGQLPSSSTVLPSTSSTSTTSASTSSAAVEVPGNGGKGRGKGYLIPIPTGPTSRRIISCKYGAVSPMAFRNFVKWLDGTSGLLVGADDIIPTDQAYPSYLTNLTVVQEDAIKTIPWVRSVRPNHRFDPIEYHDDSFARRRKITRTSTTTGSEKVTSTLGKRDIGMRLNSASHLNILSGDVDKEYRYDRTLGSGTTIFIVDSGYNTGHQELARSARSVEAWYPGNHVVMDGSRYHKPENLAPDNTEDYFTAGAIRIGHGSAAACVAGGRSLGVASNANLYLVKYKAAVKSSGGKYRTAGSTRFGLEAALEHIRKKIWERGLQGKAVVNFSWGISREVAGDEYADYQTIFNSFQRSMERNSVVIVMAAGNNGGIYGSRLGDHLPQLLGTKDNHLITVGGVHADGTLWKDSEPEGKSTFPDAADPNAGAVGSVTLYAQGVGVVSCNGDPSDLIGTSPRDGTSFASPAVAGLVAYFLGHPYYSTFFEHKANPSPDDRSVGYLMKNFLQVWASFQRLPSDKVFPPGLEADYPKPEHVRVAYNLIDDEKIDVGASRAEHQKERERLRDKFKPRKCNPMKRSARDVPSEPIIDICHPMGENEPASTTSILTASSTTASSSSTSSSTQSPTATPVSCKQDSDCEGLSCRAGEAKSCKLKALPISIIPIVFRQCECVDPLKEKEVPEFCVIDEDCQALACDASKNQKKSCVTVVPMGGSLPPIRKCKCTDPQTSTSTTSTTSPKPPPTPTTVEPPPPASPTQILPSQILICNPASPTLSCLVHGKMYCPPSQRGICKNFGVNDYCDCEERPVETEPPSDPGCPG